MSASHQEADRIRVANRLDAPSLPEGHKLHGMLAKLLLPLSLGPRPNTASLFDPSLFGLDRPTVVRDANEEICRSLCAIASRDVIQELQWIERTGMCFASKMALIAENLEERMLYTVFSAQETQHFDQIRAFNPDPAMPFSNNSFYEFLSDTVERGSRGAMMFLVQIIMEGWGLAYFKELAAGTRDKSLHGTLLGFAHDEAFHHGSGLVLFDASSLSGEDEIFIVNAMTLLLSTVRIGPQRLVAHIGEMLGGISVGSRETLFAELGGPEESQRRLDRIMKLTIASGYDRLARRLEETGLLRALSVAEAARFRP